MDSVLLYVALAFVLLLIAAVVVVALRRGGGSARSVETRPRPGIDYAPGVGDDDSVPRDTPRRTVDVIEVGEPLAGTSVVELPEPEVEALTTEDLEALLELEVPEPAAGRLQRLRARLARSHNTLGRGLLALLSRENLDEDTWDEIEETLLTADLGVAPTQELIERLRTRVRVEGASDPAKVRTMLREELIALVDPTMDRRVRAEKVDGRPGVVLVVGVNGTGKTTTTGKLARLAVASGQTVVLGAADTFRAAAAQQLQTWGDRVGAAVVRGPEGGDPAAVAFDAVSTGIAADVDTVIIDTAGRLHTKFNLMEELSKIRRVIQRKDPSAPHEVLLVLDATMGQNALIQAKAFTEAADVTSICLTKLDGTSKGGMVFAICDQLGIPVRLVGTGEKPEDLAPFSAETFVEALFR